MAPLHLFYHAPNQDKFQALGSTPEACANKPEWLRESITIEMHDGVIVQARGIEICKNPIGENDYTCTHLTKKFTNMSSAINNNYIALSKVSPHAAKLAFVFSYQIVLIIGWQQTTLTSWLNIPTHSYRER